MLGFRKVRKAKITPEHRDLYERYGETVVQMVVSAGHSPTAPALAAAFASKFSPAVAGLKDGVEGNAQFCVHFRR